MTDLTYALSIGKGKLAEQAEYLVHSIKTYAPSSDIFSFITNDEYSSLTDYQRNYFEMSTELAVLQSPIPEYPIAVKIAGLKEALDYTETEYVALLDTDTLLIRPIDADLSTTAEFFAKPVDVNQQYWTSKDSQEEWKRLYLRENKDYPGTQMKTTVDHVPIPPYWNAGSVITNQKNLVNEWLDLTSKLHPEIHDPFYADQVALAIVTAEYETVALSEQYNFPLPHRRWCPAGTNLLHYHEFRYLARILNPRVKGRVRQTGVQHASSYPKRQEFLQELGIRLYKLITSF